MRGVRECRVADVALCSSGTAQVVTRKDDLMAKTIADFAAFESLDIRVGRIVKVEEARTRKPTWRMTIDFGPEVGTKVSCGALRNYAADFLVGQQIIAVVNFPPRRMGPEVSEVLVLGVPGASGETIFLAPQQHVGLGGCVF
jgi:tRNA-binding protein